MAKPSNPWAASKSSASRPLLRRLPEPRRSASSAVPTARAAARPQPPASGSSRGTGKITGNGKDHRRTTSPVRNPAPDDPPSPWSPAGREPELDVVCTVEGSGLAGPGRRRPPRPVARPDRGLRTRPCAPVHAVLTRLPGPRPAAPSSARSTGRAKALPVRSSSRSAKSAFVGLDSRGRFGSTGAPFCFWPEGSRPTTAHQSSSTARPAPPGWRSASASRGSRDLERHLPRPATAARTPAARAEETPSAADAVILCLPDEAAKEAEGHGRPITNDAASSTPRPPSAPPSGNGPMASPEMADAVQRVRDRAARAARLEPRLLSHRLHRPDGRWSAQASCRSMPITVNAVSGYTGGGKGLIEEFGHAPPETTTTLSAPMASRSRTSMYPR